MTTNKDILTYLDEQFPLNLQLGFDNSGFITGDKNASVKKVLLALDVTDEVIDEAAKEGVNLIISHHPVIWNAMKRVTTEDTTQINIINLIKNDISVISMHTNLDIAEGGVNDVLIHLLGARSEATLDEDDCGRIGHLTGCQEMPLEQFLGICKDRLKSNGLRYHDAGKPVSKIAVLGGSGGFAVQIAWQKGCDTFVTSDIKYDQFLLARQLGLNLIDADHFCTENPAIYMLKDRLSQKYPAVDFIISKVHDQTAKFY